MNMHGFITPVSKDSPTASRSRVAGLLAWMRRHRSILLVVGLPTLLVSGYYYLLCADQYQSQAQFVVRSSDGSPGIGGGFGQMLGLAGAVSQSQSDAMSVSEYLVSHEAIERLRKPLDLIAMFRRPEADALSELRPADPTPEKLLKYYQEKVLIEFDRETGISTLNVRSFRSDDSFRLINALLTLGEDQVNQLNRRATSDAVATARTQLAEAEQNAATIQRRITNFRQGSRDIDPIGTGQAQIGTVSELNATLAAARAQLSAMGSMIDRSSPQYQAMAARVRALTSEIQSQSGRLAGSGTTIASNLGSYEDLKVRQEFAAKRYEAAAANLEKARDQASRKQLYLVRIVEPNRPVKSEFPERGRIVLTIFLGLLISYWIGWLLVAGVREHAA